MKKCFMLVLILIGVLSLSPMSAYAEGDTSVYLDGEEAEDVYRIITSQSDMVYIFRNMNLIMSKDRIMPLREINMLDYAWDGTLSVEDVTCVEHAKEENSFGNVYVGGLYLTDQTYAGYVIFCIESGVGHMHSFVPSPQYEESRGNAGAKNIAVIDYLDNRAFITGVIGEEPDADRVRLVTEPKLGYGFLVSSEEKGDLLVFAGSTSGIPGEPAFLSVEKDLKERADEELETYLANKVRYKEVAEKWESEHPGETFIWMGPSLFPRYPMEYLDEKIALKEQETETESVEETEESVTEEETTLSAEPTEEASETPENKPDQGNKADEEEGNPITTWLIPALAIVLLLLFLGAYLVVKKNK